MSEPRLVSKILLTRTPINPQSVTILADDMRGQPTWSDTTEEICGEIVGGRADFEVWLDRATALNLTDFPGGFLAEYDPELEDIFATVYLEGVKNPVWYGIIATHQSGMGDQTHTFSFDGGLEVFRRYTVDQYFTQDQIGRYHKYLINKLVANADIATMPLYFGTTPRVSYLEQPQTIFCENPPAGTIPQPNSRVMALAVNGSDVFCFVDLDLLSYSSSTHEWTYHSTISHPSLIAISGLGWQVIAMEYVAAPAPHIDFCLSRIPDGTMVRGTSPHQLMHEVYYMGVDL